MVQVCEYQSPADVHRWSKLSGGVLIIGYQALANLHKPRKARAGANLDAATAKVKLLSIQAMLFFTVCTVDEECFLLSHDSMTSVLCCSKLHDCLLTIDALTAVNAQTFVANYSLC